MGSRFDWFDSVAGGFFAVCGIVCFGFAYMSFATAKSAFHETTAMLFVGCGILSWGIVWLGVIGNKR